MNKKIFIFDWDGTLVDSAAKIINCMQGAAEQLRLDSLEPVLIKNIIGLGLPEAIRTLYPGMGERDVDRYREAYSRLFVEADQIQCELFSGVGDSLLRLKESGHILAVATGKSRKGLDRALVQRGWLGFFDVTRCADETASKPDPRMLKEILWDLGGSAEAAVMIGDTEFDMAMAQSVNVDRIAVSYGAHSIDRLTPYKPIGCIDNFSDVLKYSITCSA